MPILDHLEPQAVFSYFEQLCAIPHGSGNTKAISDFLVRFAAAHHLRCIQDAHNNVVIFSPGTPGYETAAPVILQGHMDMVCETAPDCTKDMTREGLDLFVDGDTIGARGTTLGGDDGIAVAMALAILDADDIPHPPLEIVITVDEETGMLGAAALDASVLKGRTMLNLDSEDEGVLTVSCAGGNVSVCTLPVTRAPFSGTALTVTVGGLLGGHSGAEIDKGRANSSMLLGRVLYALEQKTPLRVISVSGGLKDNAIPTASVALVAADASAVQAVCAEMDAAFKKEYRVNDPAITVSVRPAETDLLPLDESSSRSVVCMLTCLPNGIQAMSADMPGLVQTSLNLGILTTGDDAVHASFSVRSSVATQKQMLIQRLRCLMERLGGSVSTHGEYPGWEYMPQSPLRDLMVQVFTDQYGYAPKVEAIHAGLECGLFSAKLSGLDCVSFGPDLKEIHTFRESMSVASVQRVYAMVVETLKRMH
jgi:dipeptidase D